MNIRDRKELSAAATDDCGWACGELANALRLPMDAIHAEEARLKNALGLIGRARSWTQRAIDELDAMALDRTPSDNDIFRLRNSIEMAIRDLTRFPGNPDVAADVIKELRSALTGD